MEIEKNTIISCIPSIVTREMNDSLMRPISMSELEGMVFSMRKGKAPGPDGFLVEFFQEFWDIINHDLLDVVQESYSNKEILWALNATFLVLIPKKEEANQLDFFRPISLCNVVCKIVTKLLAERLKVWLPMVISKQEGGFVVENKFWMGWLLLLKPFTICVHLGNVSCSLSLIWLRLMIESIGISFGKFF